MTRETVEIPLNYQLQLPLGILDFVSRNQQVTRSVAVLEGVTEPDVRNEVSLFLSWVVREK